MINKPPLGVMPEKLWEESRVRDLSMAIYDHIHQGQMFAMNFDSLKSWCDELVRRIRVIDERMFLSSTERKIIGMASSGFGKIQCIKAYRSLYPWVGLKEAKVKIESLCDGYFTSTRKYLAKATDETK